MISKKPKRKRVITIVSSFLLLVLGIMGWRIYLERGLPNQINIVPGEENYFGFKIPIGFDIAEEQGAIRILNDKDEETDFLDLREQFSVPSSSQPGSYKLELKAFGLFSLKTVNFNIVKKQEVYALGVPAGMIIKTNGILTLGTGTVRGIDGNEYEPCKDKIEPGDYIVKINNMPISNKEELIETIENVGQNDVLLTVRRDGKLKNVTITPVLSKTLGKYKIGIWVRDDTQGIGTITYATKDGQFGALGHGINDVDTKKLIEIAEGQLYNTKIMEIVKGKSGSPGEISGVIIPSFENRIGTIKENTAYGVFGNLSKSYLKNIDAIQYPIGFRQEIRTGEAIVRSTLEGKSHDYKIKITKIYRNSTDNKSMVIEIVDERLLSLTNGIVQGMSGSPIIQDGKLIGAVTHVFIQDSKKGYATFIENMMK